MSIVKEELYKNMHYVVEMTNVEIGIWNRWYYEVSVFIPCHIKQLYEEVNRQLGIYVIPLKSMARFDMKFIKSKPPYVITWKYVYGAIKLEAVEKDIRNVINIYHKYVCGI